MTEGAFELISGHGKLLFVCDHASPALPKGYGTLGLAPALFATHIAFDIGAAEVTRALAAGFGAPAILGRWSRLLIDLNRGADDPTLIMALSDGSLIAGNRNLGADEKARRIARFHEPYHQAIAREISRLQSSSRARASALAGERDGQPSPSSAVAGVRPAKGPPDLLPTASRASEGRRGPSIISLHSFTPRWKGKPRAWEVGVLWDKDGRLALPLMARLAEAGFVVGDNEPYSGALEGDTMNRHGTRAGLPHALIEMRQDLIGDAGAARAFASRLQPILAAALADMAAAD